MTEWTSECIRSIGRYDSRLPRRRVIEKEMPYNWSLAEISIGYVYLSYNAISTLIRRASETLLCVYSSRECLCGATLNTFDAAAFHSGSSCKTVASTKKKKHHPQIKKVWNSQEIYHETLHVSGQKTLRVDFALTWRPEQRGVPAPAPPHTPSYEFTLKRQPDDSEGKPDVYLLTKVAPN